MTNYENLLKDYKENGWVKIDSLFTKEECNDLILNINRFYEQYKSQFEKHDFNLTKNHVNSIHCLHKFGDAYFNKVQNSKKVLDITNVLLEDESECRGSEAFLKPAGEGLKSPWHQDDFYWCITDHNALTVWVALDDIDESNGGLTYYEKSHKLGLLDHENSYAPGSSQQVKASILKELSNKVVCPKLKVGDALIHHSLTIHGSADNTSPRSRRGFTIQLKGKSSAYDKARKDHYLTQLMKQVEERNK